MTSREEFRTVVLMFLGALPSQLKDGLVPAIEFNPGVPYYCCIFVFCLRHLSLSCFFIFVFVVVLATQFSECGSGTDCRYI